MLKWLRRIFKKPPCDLCGQRDSNREVRHRSQWADGHYERLYRSCEVCWDDDDHPILVDTFIERTGKGTWVPNGLGTEI